MRKCCLSLVPLVVVLLLLKAILYAGTWRVLSELEYVASISYPLLGCLIIADAVFFGLYFSQKRKFIRSSLFLLYCQFCTFLGFAFLVVMQVATYVLTL